MMFMIIVITIVDDDKYGILLDHLLTKTNSKSNVSSFLQTYLKF